MNNFNLFGNQAISKFATATTTGVVTANTALTLGDLFVANTTANPTTNRYSWHLVTASGAANGSDNTLRLDGANAIPTYATSSNWSKLTPTATAAVNGTSQLTMDFVAGDLVLPSDLTPTILEHAWHIVTTAESVWPCRSNTLRLDGAT